MRILFIFLILLLGCATIKITYQEKRKIPYIKVLLASTETVDIECDGLYYENKRINCKKVKIDKSTIYIDGKKFSNFNSICTLFAKKFIKFNNTNYRGKFIIYGNGDSLLIVNKLTVEDYLRGVLPNEMESKEIEAVKSQAVAARSFALSKLSNNKFDVTADVTSQVYSGVDCENSISNEAIETTFGIVCTYNSIPINAMYHSTCGGKTADGNAPYLKSTLCKFCENSPHYRWEIEFDSDNFLVEKVESINIKRNNSGRVEEVNIKGDKINRKITGNEFRKLLNLKSTYFDIKMLGKKIKIEGRGYGHGVGLCQYGAMEMARHGFDYKSILRYYYKGIAIHRIY